MLGARESRTFFIGPRNSGFFQLPWIFNPGQYAFRVHFEHAGTTSALVPYTIDEPAGEDRLVWQRMTKILDNAPPTDRSAAFLFEVDDRMAASYAAHPTSVYARLARVAEDEFLHLSYDDGVNLTKTTLAMPLPALELDDLRLALAGTYKRWARHLATTNIDEAVAKAAEGVSILRELVSSRDPYAAVNAQAMLASEGWTKADLMKMSGPKPLKPTHPRVDCVAVNNDGTFTAWFGYDNPNDGLYGVPIGGRNHFEPAPDNRGQPSWLNTIGRAERVFSVTAPIGEQIAWVLEGTRATASANEGIKHCDDRPAQGH